MKADLEEDPRWRDKALCAKPAVKAMGINFWFEGDQTLPKRICKECPVRALCLKERLETPDLYGTSGGLDEDEARATLSVDVDGKEVRRGEFPTCPFCDASTEHLVPTTVDLPDGGRWSVAKAVECSVCEFQWKSRSSHNAVTAFFKEQAKKAELARKERIAQERLNNS